MRDEDLLATDPLDVAAWLDPKVAAILARRSEVERGAGPGAIARLDAGERARLLSMEWLIRSDLPSLR